MKIEEHEPTTGNAAAIREALSDACYAMFNFLKAQNGGYEEMANALDKAKAALASPPRNCDVGTAANVGELMEVALAAAGSFATVTGGRTACETDYLAASGATFPASVTYEQMVEFNRRTLKPDMDEAAEMRRYALIARFWRRDV